jgi:hypothetical protein
LFGATTKEINASVDHDTNLAGSHERRLLPLFAAKEQQDFMYAASMFVVAERIYWVLFNRECRGRLQLTPRQHQ